jgi:hypothetical protein
MNGFESILKGKRDKQAKATYQFLQMRDLMMYGTTQPNIFKVIKGGE